MKKVIWLTGRSGSGKSVVAKFFGSVGFEIIDADVIGHGILNPSSPAYNEIVSFFGRDVVNEDNSINRKKLGARVFANPDELEILNKITHKYIYMEMKERIAASDKRVIVIDAALLPEEKIYDKIIVVSAPDSERINRIKARDNISDESAMMRLSSQDDEDEYIKNADFVIENSGTVPKLEEKLRALFDDIESIW